MQPDAMLMHNSDHTFRRSHWEDFAAFGLMLPVQTGIRQVMTEKHTYYFICVSGRVF